MKLKPYQIEGAAHLAKFPRAALWDEPGTGKTAQALEALKLIEARRPLAIVPASAVPVWRAEGANWSGKPFPAISYEMALKSPAAWTSFDAIIFDEAHYLKSPTAQRTLFAQKLVRENPSAYLWFLTGTPMPNHIGESFTQVTLVDPWLVSRQGIRTYRDWLNKWAVWFEGDHGPRVKGVKDAEGFKAWLRASGRFKRRTWAEIGSQLPPVLVHTLPVDIDQDPDIGIIDEGMERLAAAFEHPGHVGGAASATRHRLGIAKARAVLPILAEELSADPMLSLVVFAYHREALRVLAEGLAPHGVSYIDGSTLDRDTPVTLFQRGQNRVFIGQNQAAGTAIGLTASQEIVLVEPEWVPGVNEQIIKRVRRMGQNRPVRARFVYAADTLDDDITRVTARKVRDILSTDIKEEIR